MTDGVRRILVAVADSAASLDAARAAVVLAARVGAELRFVHVEQDGVLDAALGAPGGPPLLAERRESGAEALLRHVAEMARTAGVPASTALRDGEIGPGVLDEVREWGADLLVVGRTTRRGAGDPFIGAGAQRILEFSDRPVLVVPQHIPAPSR